MAKRTGTTQAMGIHDWAKCEAMVAGMIAGAIVSFHKALYDNWTGADGGDNIPDITYAYAESLLERTKGLEFQLLPGTPSNHVEAN